MLEDMAVLTNGQLITEDAFEIRKCNFRYAENCRRITINKETTTIVAEGNRESS